MSFYDDLAAAKTNGTSDGDYVAPGQVGTVLLHGVINKQTSTKRSVILVGEIASAKAKVSGATTQNAGTKIKKIYSLSKYDWHLNMLKTDLINIVGASEKDMTPKQVAEMFKDVFEGGALKGVLCSFDSFSKAREGKAAIDGCNFGHLDEKQGNSEKEIAARAGKIEDLDAE